MSNPIKAWSFSRLSIFEQCAFRAKLAYVDKIPEPERPLPKGKTEHANDRGSRIHDAAEAYVRGNALMTDELHNFDAEFRKLNELFKQGRVQLEGEWAVDQSWEPTAWRSSDTWGRIKLDALVTLTPDHAVVIDYKTGRKYGNEVSHAKQGQLYQLATFLRYPELQTIDVEFWYLDQDEITTTRYTRRQGERFFKYFDQQARAMTEAVEFPPKPNMYSCRWCPYGPKGTGDCKVGV